MAVEIKVTPQYLRERRSRWEELARQAQKDYQEAAAQAKELGRHLGGGPAERLGAEFVHIGQEGERAFQGMRSQLVKLDEIAAVYSEAERSNTNVTADH